MHKLPLTLLLAGFFASVPPALAAPPFNPTLLVNPFIGTSTTPDGSDVIDDFPGADVPFGMVQWSPDTPSQNAGGGYEYQDKAITGFSLTHLSGPGCSVFGDIGILPTTGAVQDPANAQQPFSHAAEEAAPGWYAVTLGNPGVRTELTVTKRTGLGRFTYPAMRQANLLFNVSSNQAGVNDAAVRVAGSDEVSGWAASGGFCGMPDRYRVYFVAKFNRPFVAHGTWNGSAVSPGSPAAQGAGSGAWVTFDTSTDQRVLVKVGLSFVDEAGARANLQAENRGWNLIAVRNDATRAWQRMLERIRVDGGTPGERHSFYTALYHALLHPNVYSDVTGLYRGYDDRVHHVAGGRTEYANYSDWDIYRTQIPLIALIAPHEVSDMMQSLVDAAHQDGRLPRWALLNSATSVMGGDSVDPVIAGAYAFGARDFDVRGALRAMVKGASDTTSPPADGWYIERPELSEYLQRGYIVNTHTTSVSPVPNGASETLEYALDDFSIAQFARQIGDDGVYREYLKRSANWSNVFDTATGLAAPRDSEGAFMHTPITESGQSGFQEGNAAQYTWMVPQDLGDLIRGMGGQAAALAKLDTFFTQINAGEDKPYAWLGNEPTLGSPWVYLYTGAPWRAQAIVRTSLTTMFADTPQGLPGNDDLGTMSAWWMWCAMGLYPQNPSVRVLDVGSPLFRQVTIDAPGGPTIRINAPAAADAAPYVQALRVDGRASQRTWLALPTRGTVTLDFDLSTLPDRRWGAAAGDAPPSFAPASVSFPVTTTANLSDASPQVIVAPGSSASYGFEIRNTGAAEQSVQWQAHLPAGVRAVPAQGALTVAPGGTAIVRVHLSVGSDMRAGLYDVPISATGNGAPIAQLTAMVRVQQSGEIPHLGYIENRWDDTVTPIDPRTGAIGADIKAGAEPRDAVLSPDGRRLYVADRSGQAVAVIDTGKQTLIASVKVGHAPNGVQITPDGKTLWVANADDATVQSIDTETLKASAPISVGKNPRYIAVAPDGGTVYVTNQGANSVTPVDTRTRAVAPAIPIGALPAGIAITPDGKKAYVADFGSNEVTPIDLARRVALPAIPVGVSPIVVAIAPDGKTALVSNYAATTVTPIDLTTDSAKPAIEVGGAPYGIVFTADAQTAIVVIRRDNACVFLDMRTGRVGAPVRLGTSPYTIAM